MILVTNHPLPRRRLQSAPDQREAMKAIDLEAIDHKEEAHQVLEVAEAEVEEDTMMKVHAKKEEIKEVLEILNREAQEDLIKEVQKVSIKEAQDLTTEINNQEEEVQAQEEAW